MRTNVQVNKDLQDRLITYIEDAYAMEHQIEKQLEHQVRETQKYPDIQLRIQEHLDATKQHRERMEQCLAAYNRKPSAVKGAMTGMTGMMGNMMGALSGARLDPLAKTARDDYMIEHMEIGAYELLIATAQACGDTDTVRACQLNLADEVRLANWLEHNLGKTAMLSFQDAGIPIDQQAILAANDAAVRSLRSAQTGTPSMGAMGGIDQLDQTAQATSSGTL
jgi:ferritin-like metal-binding protein YciE